MDDTLRSKQSSASVRNTRLLGYLGISNTVQSTECWPAWTCRTSPAHRSTCYCCLRATL